MLIFARVPQTAGSATESGQLLIPFASQIHLFYRNYWDRRAAPLWLHVQLPMKRTFPNIDGSYELLYIYQLKKTKTQLYLWFVKSIGVIERV